MACQQVVARGGRRTDVTGFRPHRIGLVFGLTLLALALTPARLEAAGSAYVVDTAEVSEPGSCKVESWASWADNHDFIASMTPTCVVDVGHPVEASAQVTRSRSDGDWTTTVSPKLKTNLLPTAIGRFGFAISGTATIDTISREATAFQVVVPATLRLSEHVRLNLNVGWMLDRVLNAHFLIYGAGFDWIVYGPWTVTGEVFGQTGHEGLGDIVKPRWQAGLRYRPIDAFNVDLVYGRNITGENANWLTLATTVRF